MRLETKLRSYAHVIRWLLIALLILYPLAGAFLGLDLGDTGYHLYAYTNLVSHPDKINYTTYLSSVIGYLWNLIFGGLGLLAFNFLEVLLEWGLVWMVYRTLHKDLGKLTVLAGSLFALAAADAYLNIFNYHQLNAFLLTAILCLEYRAMTDGRWRFSFLAGVVYTLVVFSRVGSVVALVTCALYVYHAVMHEWPYKEMARHLLCFAAGAASLGLGLVLCLAATGRLSYFISNIFRLGGIAADNSTSYGFSNLLRTLIEDNLNVIASGFLFYAAAAVLACGINTALQPCGTRIRKLFAVLVGLFVSLVALYQMYYAYDVNPAENWPQMTTGQRFVIGVMYVTAFLCFAYHAFRRDCHSRRMSLLVIASCMLVILTIAGSNTATKHVILGMWLLGPVCVYTLRKLLTSSFLTKQARLLAERAGKSLHPKTIAIAAVLSFAMFFAKYGHMLYFTFNYDSVNRLALTATVDNRRVRGILTTQRQADALNGVLSLLEEYDEEQPLLVFGNSLLFYYMTEREAYGKPWVTQSSYPTETFREDLNAAKEEFADTLPLIVYCRTNYAYGFDEEDAALNQQMVTYDAYGGKKECLMEFLESNRYGIEYMNDYYAVLIPDLTDDMAGLHSMMFGN